MLIGGFFLYVSYYGCDQTQAQRILAARNHGDARKALVIASVTAFTLSELADLAIYTPLQKRGLVLAVVASSVVGLVVDSLLFLWLAFGSLDFLAGQILGKAWMVLIALPFVTSIPALQGAMMWVSVIVGVVLIATAGMKFCPLYRVLGVNTCKL